MQHFIHKRQFIKFHEWKHKISLNSPFHRQMNQVNKINKNLNVFMLTGGSLILLHKQLSELTKLMFLLLMQVIACLYIE